MNEKLQADLKAAMIAKDAFLLDIIKGLKSAILYEAVAKGKKDEGLNDDEILTVIAREAKKRDDSATIYVGAGNKEAAEREIAEAEVLRKYLPEQLTEEELTEVIDNVIAQTGADSMKDMGRVIGAVKAEVGAKGDGAKISMIVKAKLQ